MTATVTAIGSPEPEPGYGVTSANAMSSSGPWSTSITTTRPSVSFDDWDSAVKFALVIAKQHNGVKVSKVGAVWTVAWTDYGLPAINPVYPRPWSPGYPYPIRVTYTSRIAA